MIPPIPVPLDTGWQQSDWVPDHLCARPPQAGGGVRVIGTDEEKNAMSPLLSSEKAGNDGKYEIQPLKNGLSNSKRIPESGQ